MKLFKFAAIALIAAASFGKAEAQVIVKARIGGGHVQQRPVRRVYRRPYHRPYHRRAVIVRERGHHRAVRHRY